MEVLTGFLLDLPQWFILSAVSGVLLYMFNTRTFNTWSRQGIKGPKPYPILGTFLTSIKFGNIARSDVYIRDTFGRISGSFRGSTPVLNVADPEYLRVTMVKSFTNMPNRRDSSRGHPLLDNFMTSLTDDHWRHVRSSVSPSFTSGKLKQVKAHVDVCAEMMVEHIASQEGRPFDSKTFTGGYTMDVISSTAFGIQVDSQKNPNHPMLINGNKVLGVNQSNGVFRKIRNMTQMILFFLAPGFVQRLLAKLGVSVIDLDAAEYFQDVTSKILADRSRETQNSKRKDFVQLCLNQLIDDPKSGDADAQVDRHGQVWSTKGLTKNEIVSNAILFFLAGFETTATTLNFILYELTMNPDVQQRVYENIMENVSSDVATYEELSKMEYIDWAIQEAMRIYPAAPRVERLVAKDTTVEGIHVPAGSMVSAMIYAIHHDPEIWPEPNKFDPERFSPENSEGRHQYAWMPFGIGNRNCIGMRLALLEMKIAIVKILTNFVLESCEDTPDRPIKLARSIRMEPEKKIKISAKRRNI